MRSNPEPRNLTVLAIAEHTIATSHTRRPEIAPLVHFLEVEARVEWIAQELLICLSCLPADCGRQRPIQFPESIRGVRIQSSSPISAGVGHGRLGDCFASAMSLSSTGPERGSASKACHSALSRRSSISSARRFCASGGNRSARSTNALNRSVIIVVGLLSDTNVPRYGANQRHNPPLLIEIVPTGAKGTFRRQAPPQTRASLSGLAMTQIV